MALIREFPWPSQAKGQVRPLGQKGRVFFGRNVSNQKLERVKSLRLLKDLLVVHSALCKTTGHLEDLHGLPNAEVGHDLLGATGDRESPNLAINALDFLALASANIGGTTEDLSSLTSAVLEHFGGVHLQQRSSTAQLQILLLTSHD